MFQQAFSVDPLPISLAEFKQKALHWANSFPQVAYYEPNQIAFPHQGFQNFLAVSNTFLTINQDKALDSLQTKVDNIQQTLCCILSYELKNQIEPLTTRHTDKIQFPVLHYFYPEITINFRENFIIIYSKSNDCHHLFKEILNTPLPDKISEQSIQVKESISKKEYIRQVNKIKKQILEGDVYELNYCQEFHAEVKAFNPITVFNALNQLSPMPFAGFYKVNDRYLLCASPERFLKKSGNTLIAQPIKGTIRRGQTAIEDEQLKQELATNEKEIAENMMIMDLVRNDLARCSKIGTVKVEEMFSVYAFRQVYQMITTIRSQVAPTTPLSQILRCTFPMGSMTGAPKIQAMRLIDHYENFARGLYSGSLGYILPNGNFDFNVVIRSIQYNQSNEHLSFAVGSAITYDSDPEKEYEECLLKSESILKIINS
ncbi:anthranilate synthase component I family protein [Adhaeribacter radiodurans]|uniref:Anthranilate synthase component I family protein n=1 Tax=Adhaeribacter radiodurans TaxID=2745197 RepID=A0A7L7L632_9BACT|nr:anthranilate synthase component I family protein [Adhaeribacter radiodurans]QMU28282.1 anthranilate synthase component I family protein [Adhaeribacter radiodurans]